MPLRVINICRLQIHHIICQSWPWIPNNNRNSALCTGCTKLIYAILLVLAIGSVFLGNRRYSQTLWRCTSVHLNRCSWIVGNVVVDSPGMRSEISVIVSYLGFESNTLVPYRHFVKKNIKRYWSMISYSTFIVNVSWCTWSSKGYVVETKCHFIFTIDVFERLRATGYWSWSTDT